MLSERNLSFTGQFEDVGSIIRVLSAVLTQLIDVNQKSNTRQHFITKFQSSYAPNITIQAYLERINKYAKCSPNCFIVALIYIDRLIEIRNIVLTSLNVHRILITSILLSTKVFDDEFYKNAYYAKLGGVSTSEMNTLEVEFLSLVNFNLYVSTETFEKYRQELQSFLTVSSSTPIISSEPNLPQIKKGPPPVSVSDSERIQDPDLNSISPLRPFDVNNVTGLRSLLFNSHVQISSLTAAVSSQISTSSLFSHEETLPQCPSSHSSSTASTSGWPSSSSSSMLAVASHESPRSLASYPSTDPSPTLSSTTAVGSLPCHCPPPHTLYPTCQKQDNSNRHEVVYPETHVLVTPMNNNNNNAVGIASGDMEYIFAYPMAPPPPPHHHHHPLTAQSFPRSFPSNVTMSQSGDPINKFPSHSQVSAQTHAQTQAHAHAQTHLPKYSSRPRVTAAPSLATATTAAAAAAAQCYNNTTPAIAQTQQNHNTRVLPPYQSRLSHHSYENNNNSGGGGGNGNGGSCCNSSSNLQHYDASGYGYNLSQQSASFPHAIPYHPNSCGFFPTTQTTQLPFCPVPSKNYPSNQSQFQGVAYNHHHPPQQLQYVGGFYYQPIPSHLMPVPGPRFLTPATTPNSVADIFGPGKIESTSSRQHQASFHQSEDFMHRSNPQLQQPVGRCGVGVGYIGGSNPHGGIQQHPYYLWNEQPDQLGCSIGNGPHFHHNIAPAGMHYEMNSYPATTLFYPVPLPTVS